jgi:hypothetical protein
MSAFRIPDQLSITDIVDMALATEHEKEAALKAFVARHDGNPEMEEVADNHYQIKLSVEETEELLTAAARADRLAEELRTVKAIAELAMTQRADQRIEIGRLHAALAEANAQLRDSDADEADEIRMIRRQMYRLEIERALLMELMTGKRDA